MSFITIMREHWQNRGMLWNLSKNDFKARYATSFLGVAWAYVQPLCTLLVFWFVFQVGLRSADIGGIPFIVWYAPAYLIWTFFQDAVANMTNCIKDYNYLVRKVHFKISLIPTVKLIPGIFVHLGFFLFIIGLNLVYGTPVHISNLQIVYYFILRHRLRLRVRPGLRDHRTVCRGHQEHRERGHDGRLLGDPHRLEYRGSRKSGYPDDP